jgi:tryptophanyl-tRNA synthetase
VNLLDDEKTIRKTIMSAVTDSERETRFKHASPGVLNLLTLYETLTGESREAIEAKFEGQGYGALKKEVANVIIESLAPLQQRYSDIMADRDALERTLTKGAERAREIAAKTLAKMKRATGLG